VFLEKGQYGAQRLARVSQEAIAARKKKGKSKKEQNGEQAINSWPGITGGRAGKNRFSISLSNTSLKKKKRGRGEKERKKKRRVDE